MCRVANFYWKTQYSLEIAPRKPPSASTSLLPIRRALSSPPHFFVTTTHASDSHTTRQFSILLRPLTSHFGRPARLYSISRTFICTSNSALIISLPPLPFADCFLPLSPTFLQPYTPFLLASTLPSSLLLPSPVPLSFTFNCARPREQPNRSHTPFPRRPHLLARRPPPLRMGRWPHPAVRAR